MASCTYPQMVLLLVLAFCSIWSSLAYDRPKPRGTLSVPLPEDADGFTPQQVHVSMVGSDKIRVTWITDDDASSMVEYGTTPGQYPFSATGSSSTYSHLFYHSGHIHDVVIGPLHPNTIYYYRCSSNSARRFSLKTPPRSLPMKLAIVGDLGQTGWTESTLKHLAAWNHDMLLLPGDLSYADCIQTLWDSFGRLVEPLASSRPWMVTQGNHEIERFPFIRSFKAYNARWRMPYDVSSSDSNLYYSFDVAGGAIHVLMLGSYADFGPGSSQYIWLQADLAKIDRARTPWVVALIHAPWYNSNEAHQGEGEEMRQAVEEILYAARVDVVFTGHVHAYERFTRVYDNKKDDCAPVHITVGDGGNREGLARDYIEPQPNISLFREASFGHGRFEVMNTTHALWTWHRNDNDVAVVGDQVLIANLASNPACNPKI